MVALYSLISVVGVSLLSLLGILFFVIEEKRIRTSLLYIVSFSTGALLGDVFMHILPDLAENKDLFPQSLMIVLGGIVFSFAVEKIIHWRHCHVFPDDHGGHDHDHAVGIMSLMAESMHNFIDGIVIAASFLAGTRIGFATTLAVMFHEIPHEIGNFAVLLHSGFTKRKALVFNVLSATSAIVGAIIVILASRSFEGFTSSLLPFAAGNLLYIAGSDLIPELHKQTLLRQGVLQLIGMICGMGFMYMMVFFG